MTQVAKQMTLLIFIAVALILAFVGFFFADDSLAWFSENETAAAGGLSVNATISPNLIIGKSVDEITGSDLSFSVDFNGMARKDMVAVTRDETVANTMLKYLTNHDAVDNVTGNAKDGMKLEFEGVPETENEQYFIDYTVYIASAFKPLDVSSLYATIVMPESDESTPPYFNAISIDFYVGEVSLAGYKGTTSVSSGAAVELLGEGETVPLNTNGYITVIMRSYFDGALQDAETNNAYINSYTVGSDGAVVGVDFIAIDAETE